MLVSHPFRDFGGNYDYFFINRFGKLSCIKSEKKLEVGSLIFLEAFPVGDHLLRVTELTQKEGKTIIEWESARRNYLYATDTRGILTVIYRFIQCEKQLH